MCGLLVACTLFLLHLVSLAIAFFLRSAVGHCLLMCNVCVCGPVRTVLDVARKKHGNVRKVMMKMNTNYAN